MLQKRVAVICHLTVFGFRPLGHMAFTNVKSYLKTFLVIFFHKGYTLIFSIDAALYAILHHCICTGLNLNIENHDLLTGRSDLAISTLH